MLYCKACRYVVDAGANTCRNCGNGFVSALVCGTCTKEIPRGAASCATCEPRVPGATAGLVPVPQVYPHQPPPGVQITIMPLDGPLPGAPPVMGGLALPGVPNGLLVPVQESYSHGRFGVQAEVQLNGRDADILTKMKQTAALLHVLAQEMNNLQGHMPSTRSVIKSCRSLAADLLGEVEERLGPQG